MQPRCSSVTGLGSLAPETEAVGPASLLLSTLRWLLSKWKSVEFGDETLEKLSKTFLWFAWLAISFAVCWIINIGWFMTHVARKRYFPATLKLWCCSPCLHPTPAIALPCWHAKYCWVGSTSTMPVWRKGVNTFPLWITGNCLRSWSDIQSCKLGNGLSNPDTPRDNWADWLGSGHLSCPSSSCCSISLRCRRTRGAQMRMEVFHKGCTDKVLMLYYTQGMQASLKTGGSSARCVYFPISCSFHVKTQPIKWAIRHLPHLQILLPKLNLYTLMGMAVSFPSCTYLNAFWLFALWSPVLKSVSFFL